MAGKPQNRLELRRQYDAAEPLDPMEDEAEDIAEDIDDDEQERRPKRKPKAPAKVKTKTAKPAARMRIVWTVMNDAFKPVGTFEFSKKEEALARAAELTAKGKGTHFVQKTKEAMPDDAPGLGAIIPRPVAAPAPAAVTKAAKPVEDEVEEDEETDEEVEIEEEEDDEE